MLLIAVESHDCFYRALSVLLHCNAVALCSWVGNRGSIGLGKPKLLGVAIVLPACADAFQVRISLVETTGYCAAMLMSLHSMPYVPPSPTAASTPWLSYVVGQERWRMNWVPVNWQVSELFLVGYDWWRS